MVLQRGADKDTVVIDMSSIDPVESKKIAAELKERTGMEMLDCPVPAESQRQLMEPYLSCVVVRKRYLTSTLTY